MKVFYKMPRFVLIFLTALLLSNCEGDDESLSNFSYFPLNVGNSWTYDVSSQGTTMVDELEIISSNGDSYELQSTPAVPVALMSNALSNATLTSSNGSLRGTGSLTFDLFGLENLEFEVVDAALYDQNATVGSILSTVNGQVTRPAQGFELKIEYQSTTVQQESIDDLVVNGENYIDVIHSQLIINAKVVTEIEINSFVIPITVMDSQDIFVVDNYWARDVGLIKSNSLFSYELEDFSQFNINLPFPQTAEVLTVQDLTAFNLSN